MYFWTSIPNDSIIKFLLSAIAFSISRFTFPLP